MIVFNNWIISVSGLLAMQYDNLSRSLDVVGDIPSGYKWEMLVEADEYKDTIALKRTETGLSAVLTADNLSVAGMYGFQLRATLETDGVTQRHTNVVFAAVPASLTGDGNWPEIPTAYQQYREDMITLASHPPIPGINGYWLIWSLDYGVYEESTFPLPEGSAGGGTMNHDKLNNRDAVDQHPMSAITGLEVALDGKQPVGSYLIKELDPTVPEWAKQPQKPAYTAQEVGALPDTTHIPSTAEDVNAEPAGAVSQHNVSDAAHSDIRLLIQGLSERLSAVADSDDTTLDQLSEIVAYIKSNKSLIDAITTSKINVADIVDNLTTNVANKPLSAAQGVALKALVDALAEAIPQPYTLPVASSNVLGGVKPVAKTAEMTQSVGVDEAGGLWAPPGSGGGSGGEHLVLLNSITMEEDGTFSITQDFEGNPISEKHIIVVAKIPAYSDNKDSNLKIFGSDGNSVVVAYGLNVFTTVAFHFHEIVVVGGELIDRFTYFKAAPSISVNGTNNSRYLDFPYNICGIANHYNFVPAGTEIYVYAVR